MARTYDPIASSTLGADAANVEFTSLSGNYTDLIVVCSTIATAANDIRLTVNGDTATNYSYTHLRGNGSAASSARASSNGNINIGAPLSGQSSSNYTLTKLTICSYANTNVFKTVLFESGLAGTEVLRGVGLWRSTSAITSVKIACDSTAQFKIGSTFAVYGIKAA